MGNNDQSASNSFTNSGNELGEAQLQLAIKTRELEEFISKADDLYEMLAKTISQRDRANLLLAERTEELASSIEATATATKATATEHEARIIANEVTAVAIAATGN